MDVPETQYAKTVDGVHIAYQVLGDGPVDFVCTPARGSHHIEYRWELPIYASFLRRIASFSRLIMFDRRGLGMSDHHAHRPASRPRNMCMDDLHAVMERAGQNVR